MFRHIYKQVFSLVSKSGDIMAVKY